ncbi:MAG: hypothetical protein AAF203_11395 [Pseudomonadota bacterium]
MKIIVRMVILFVFLGNAPCLANIALRAKSFSPLCESRNGKREHFKVDPRVAEVSKDEGLTNEDIKAVFPMDLRTTDNSAQVRDKVLRRTAKSLMESPLVKNSKLFRTAKKVEKSTKVGMEIKETKKKAVGKPPLQHKFDVNVQALKGQARLTYKGYLNSKVEYHAGSDRVEIAIEENLGTNSKIALSHQKDRWESRQFLHYQLNW